MAQSPIPSTPILQFQTWTFGPLDPVDLTAISFGRKTANFFFFKGWANGRSPRIGLRYQFKLCGFEWANDGSKAVKLCRGGRIAGMLEVRTQEYSDIIQALDLGYKIEGRIASLQIFQECDSHRRLVKGKITWYLVADPEFE